jgi:pyrimidine-nucleoside phosphorylase
MALIGQTAEIAPADKKIYALRDVTSTVENIGLICASIMSKKLAEGIDALVLDVKTGSGAFLQKEEDSVCLAELMVDTARRMGKKSVALITDMDQPLGKFAGHSHEVIESIEVLRGRGAADLCELSIELSAWMFFLGERTKSVDEGRVLAANLIASGAALEKLRAGIRLQSGDPLVIDDYTRLPQARHRKEIKSRSNGYLSATNCMEFGVALAMLGGGREKKEDTIDPSVGLEFHKRIGDRIATGEILVSIFYNSYAQLQEAADRIENSFSFSDQPVPRKKLVRRLIGA